MPTSGRQAIARLTTEQRANWDREGYLMVRGALAKPEVDAVVAAVDRLLAAAPAGNEGKVLNAFNVVEIETAFLDVMDHPSVLGLVADLMGTNLQLLMSQAMVRPPTSGMPLGWHHDGPKPYPFPNVGGLVPLLNLKVGWFLTDLSSPDLGNFVVVPGSHIHGVNPPRGRLEHSASETTELASEMPGAVQVLAEPGDAILFHNELWHAVAPSTADRLRKVLYYAYGPSWLRLNDREYPGASLLAECDPVRRQLLGGLSRPEDHGGMHPGAEGLPLLELLEGRSYTKVMEANFDRELDEYRGRPRA